LCMCSTVGYSLMSACAACQGASWLPWLNFTINCSKTEPPSEFPYPIPAGIRVPQWALFDVTNENDWNVSTSIVTGDFPEVGPGVILGPSDSGHSSNAGIIAGGITGGIAAISILVAALFFYRRQRQLASSAASIGDGAFNHDINKFLLPMFGQGTVISPFPEATASLMKPYNLRTYDPTTFPGFQGP